MIFNTKQLLGTDEEAKVLEVINSGERKLDNIIQLFYKK